MIRTGVAYVDTRNPRHVKSDLEDIVAHNCDFVVFAYSEFDLHFNSSAMKEMVRIAQDLGLGVYLNPWGFGKVFGGIEPLSRFVAENPNECQRTRQGAHAPAACPNSPAFSELMHFWIDTAADSGAETVFWDEPHYHYGLGDLVGGGRGSQWACACERCRRLFRERFRREMPGEMDKDVILFRDDTLVGLLSDLSDYAGERGLKNAVCVLPDENPLTGVSSWELVAAIPSISIFGTDPYWRLFGRPLEEFISGACRRVLDLCRKHGKEAQIWVQAFLLPFGTEDEVARAVELACFEGVENIASWAYLGLAFMNHKCEDHQKVWDILGGAYGKIKGASWRR
jgi:hypothetical protein